MYIWRINPLNTSEHLLAHSHLCINRWLPFAIDLVIILHAKLVLQHCGLLEMKVSPMKWSASMLISYSFLLLLLWWSFVSLIYRYSHHSHFLCHHISSIAWDTIQSSAYGALPHECYMMRDLDGACVWGINWASPATITDTYYVHVRVVIIRNTQHDALFFLPSAQQYSSLFFSLSFAKRRFRLEPGEIVGRLRQVLLWAIECHGFFSFIARETARENVFVFCLFCFNFVVACRLGVFVFGKSVMPELLLHISNAVRKRGKCGNGWLADGGCLPPSSSLLEYFEAFVLAMRAQDTKNKKKM